MIIDFEGFFAFITAKLSAILPAYQGEIPRTAGGEIEESIEYPAAAFSVILKGGSDGIEPGALTVDIWTRTTSILPGLRLAQQISGAIETVEGGVPHDAGTMTVKVAAARDAALQALTDPDDPNIRRVILNYDFTIYSKMEG